MSGKFSTCEWSGVSKLSEEDSNSSSISTSTLATLLSLTYVRTTTFHIIHTGSGSKKREERLTDLKEQEQII